jgi:hypothetical protein
MFISASRIRRAAATALAVVGVSTSASAEAAISLPSPVAPPPVGVVLTGPADLVVSNTTPSTVRVSNYGRRAAGPFSVLVSKGYIGECDWSIPAQTRRLSGLAVGASVTATIPESSFDRAVTVDYLNEVVEANELNNSGLVPYTNVIC